MSLTCSHGSYAIGRLARPMETSDAARSFFSIKPTLASTTRDVLSWSKAAAPPFGHDDPKTVVQASFSASQPPTFVHRVCSTDHDGGKMGPFRRSHANAERHFLLKADAERSPDLSHVKAEACVVRMKRGRSKWLGAAIAAASTGSISQWLGLESRG